MIDLDRVAQELRDLGYDPAPADFPEFEPGDGHALVFPYRVEIGKHKGKTFDVGISFQEDAYPEYAPHFVHVREDAPFGLRAHTTHHRAGQTWHAFSLPPIDIWDRVDKNMRSYMSGHFRRIWRDYGS